MKLKDKIRIILRGYKTINELIPGYTVFEFIKSILEAVLPFVNIYMSGRIITAIAEKGTLYELGILTLITVGLNFLITLLVNMMTRIANVKSSIFQTVMDLPLDNKIQTMDYELVEDSSIHAMRDNVTLKRQSMCRGMPRLVGWVFDTGVKSFFQLIFSVVCVVGAFTAKPAQTVGSRNIIFSPWASVILIVLFILSLIWNTYNWAISSRKEEKILGESENILRVGQYYYGVFIDYKAGKDLKLYNLRDSAMGEMAGFVNALNKVMQRCQDMSARYQALSVVNSTVMSGIIYIYVALKAFFGAFGLGCIVQYVGSLTVFTTAFSDFVSVLCDFLINAETLKEIFDFIDMPDNKYKGTLPVEKRAFCDGGDNDYEIEFRDVSFKYPGSEVYALRHISMKLHVGERLAIVGMNGSGKTTFIKLLCRLYDPADGEILLNGIDIKKYDYNEYMNIFSVVFQDFKLFSFSLGQNVAASMEFDREKVKACLEKSGFGERLKEMPQGEDTCLYKDFEESGVEISGGEAQKIALARALYKDAPFIVLDEPTAALDPIAEAEVYGKFDNIVENRTAIYISHRLSSCRFCDEIVVFDGGQIVQRGSHEQLLADANGKYYELWNAQAQYYTKMPQELNN